MVPRLPDESLRVFRLDLSPPYEDGDLDIGVQWVSPNDRPRRWYRDPPTVSGFFVDSEWFKDSHVTHEPVVSDDAFVAVWMNLPGGWAGKCSSIECEAELYVHDEEG